MATTLRRRKASSGARAHVVKPSATSTKHLSSSEQETLKGMDAQIAKVTRSKKTAIAFLKRAGIMNTSGQLLKTFR